MPDQAELDRLMAQATNTAPPQATPDAQLLAMAQDSVTANQPLPGATPNGIPGTSTDPVDTALAAAQAPAPGAPAAAPGEAPPLARQIPSGDAQVAPGTSLGAEGPVQTPQDMGAPPVPKWAGPGEPPAPGLPAAAPAPGAPVAHGGPAPVVGAHGVSFKEAGRQLDRAETLGAQAASSEEEAGKVAGQMAEDKRQAHLQQAEEIRRQTDERAVLEKAKNEGVARAQQIADEAQQKLDKFTYHDYFGTHKDENGNEVANPGGSKTLARVFSFISGFNVGAYGAPDIAYRNITAGIERDMQRQKADLALQQDRANRSREGVKDANALFDSQLAMLDLKHANLLKATAEEGEAFAMQRGDADAQARAKVLGDKLRAEFAQKHADGIEKLASSQASLAMAGAHLQLARQTAADNADAKAAALQDKKDARAAKTADADEKTIVKDEQGNPVGKVGTGRGGSVGYAASDRALGQSADRLDAIAEDIEKHGERVFTPEAIKRRRTLYENAGIAIGSQSALGKSDEALHSEKASIGAPGIPTNGILMGADLDAIRRKSAEYKAQREELRNQTLTPLTDEEKTSYLTRHPKVGVPAPGADKGAGGAGAATGASAPPAAGGARVRLRDGRVGTLFPGGKFQPDPGAP